MQFQETIGEHGKGGKMMENEDVAWQWSRMASPRNDIPDTKIPWKELTFFFFVSIAMFRFTNLKVSVALL